MKIQLKRLFTLSLCLLCFGISSYGQGIKWTEGLSWEQIKAKAKAENKYIFVDCYATWCGPCKQMDKDVYPLVEVGEAANDKFISVKVQMDTTKQDSESIKQYYIAARELEKKYSIGGFPTYLFFSPNGEIVHKAMGFQNADKFIQLVKDVQLSEKQLYTQIKACREGKMDINVVPAFIRRLNEGGDNAIALELARPYMKNYLEGLPEAKFAAKENLQFMWDFQQMSNTEDRIYKLLYEKPRIVNTIYDNPALADLWIESLFKIQYLIPAANGNAIKSKTEPNWKVINAAIVKKIDAKRAAEILVDFKHLWYCAIKDWDKACDFEIMRFQRKDLKKLPEDQFCNELNGISWTLFVYCFNKKQLEQGLAWINEAVALDERNHKPDAARIDTKANLLYKLGKTEEAIALQEKAVMMLKSTDSELHTALNKMKRGEPTWEIGVKEKRQVK
jgi:thioredoxin-related protein